MTLTRYLGKPFSDFLSCPPFSTWSFTRSEEEDLPRVEVRYECPEHGVALVCDATEEVRTIFLRPAAEAFVSDANFAMKRGDAARQFGPPTRGRGPFRHPFLGDKGAWDRWEFPDWTLHFQYAADDTVEMITLMRPDATPP